MLPTIYEHKLLWSSDVENALKEGLILFTCDSFIRKDGKYNRRNVEISKFIKERTGKDITNKQIASHLQELFRQQQQRRRGINTPGLTTNNLIVPTSFHKYINLGDDDKISFCNMDDLSLQININEIVNNLYNFLSNQMLNPRKIALCADIYYANNSAQNTNLLICGHTNAAKKTLSTKRLRNIIQSYDNKLIELIKSVPIKLFQHVEVYINFDYPNNVQNECVNYVIDQSYYSMELINLKMTAILYIYSKPIYIYYATDFDVLTLLVGSTKVYFYHRKSMGNGFRTILWNRLQKLYDEKHIDPLRTALRNHSALVTLSNADTGEILYVATHVYDYSPNFSGYKIFKVVK